MREPRTILITGASSGIGEALARHYAREGVFLGLAGRDAARLAAVAEACREAGAEVAAEVVDVTDGVATRRWIETIAAARPLDLVIANAGISAGTGKGTESAEQMQRIYATNVGGVINTIGPAVAAMLAREPAGPSGRRGQIAIMSSLASFRGFPGAPAYCASKAAVRVHGEALRGELHHRGIAVSVICPGYVRSRMTARNRFPMPMLMEAERAARIIARGLARNRARIAFPVPLYMATWLLGALPAWLTDPLLRKLPKKE